MRLKCCGRGVYVLPPNLSSGPTASRFVAINRQRVANFDQYWLKYGYQIKPLKLFSNVTICMWILTTHSNLVSGRYRWISRVPLWIKKLLADVWILNYVTSVKHENMYVRAGRAGWGDGVGWQKEGVGETYLTKDLALNFIIPFGAHRVCALDDWNL